MIASLHQSWTSCHVAVVQYTSQASVQYYDLHWQNSTGHAQILGFCTFRSLCVRGRPAKIRRTEYSLNAQAVSDADARIFKDVFRCCLDTQNPTDDYFRVRF